MGLFKSSSSVCPGNQHCLEWASSYLKYCLCSVEDEVSLTLGLVSVLSWGVAEVPQIITNYKEKSTEGLSIAFLTTWIIGDLFNLFGCLLEPATLPTQYYMAMLYTITTLVLTTQTIYYGHIYPRLNSSRWFHKVGVDQNEESNNDMGMKAVNGVDGWQNGCSCNGVPLSSPIPVTLPVVPRNSSRTESCYRSARYLSRSYSSTLGSFLAGRTARNSARSWNPIEEPLLGELGSPRSAPPPKTKTMLCVIYVVIFLFGILNVRLSANKSVLEKQNQGVVMQVGRKLLQVGDRWLQESGGEGRSGIGNLLGWAMAAIYMGGRLPQICLNIRRGNVKGLNPCMFIFAFVGNVTYVASILVSSMDWSKIQPNLPWIVDAGGCALLDSFILIQFIYFHLRARQHHENKHGNSSAA
ncbi:uncharacterized protein LOC131144484 [Malania oleifera]|uniref:uncharacterized protein LOC131144484 n=1 Tax=Malania oleifera TaxID=397392 RepID=UPI0025ADF16B|nr:uncharacterized protein LOC131144484 [Malania oleifera]XP_057949150.1 uncharacterized protein LOC131144484 [Malania oleifera]